MLSAYFVVSLIVALYGVVFLGKSLRIGRDETGRGNAIGLAVFMIGLGLFNIAATVPSMFLDEPYWLVDKLFNGLDGALSLFGLERA